MTVSYQYDVASSSTGGFFRLLWRWRGSIWKLLYKELLLFSVVYLSIAFAYDFLMTDYYKRYYERIVIFCSAFVEIIPLSFILGFYVSFTATRWWQQYTAIPWPDKLMNIIALYVPGNDVTSRVLRRTLMRYLNLTLVLVLRSISIPVKRRFPTKEHLVEAGFMSRPELDMYSSVPSHEFNTFWIPCTWFVNLLREAKSECRITDSGGIKLIMEEFNEFRSKCGLLWSYDWVSIPLVYTQLGEQLINPFGDDDEDFELNWIIDRHLKVSFLGVDILNSDPPPLIKDNYFDEMDIKLPYTEAAVAHKVKTYRGSVAAFQVPMDKHGLVIPEFEDEENGEVDELTGGSIQSNRDATVRTSSWSLFGRKRKLSGSIDSFNSETMVETGLDDETEMPTIQPNTSWSSFLVSENKTNGGNDGSMSSNKSKSGVWPNEMAMEGTQGIRGPQQSGTGMDHYFSTSTHSPEQNGHKQQDPWKLQQGENECGGSSNVSKNKILNINESELVKQSSFSTSDSSIVIPLGEETDHSIGSNHSSKHTGFRKSALQVFSKEYAHTPMSAFKAALDATPSNYGERSSISSMSQRSERHNSMSHLPPPKPPKSLMKCHRNVDPKLRIRPFRSKVTFSSDTKAGDNTTGRFDSARFKWDSSSDSVSSMRSMPNEPLTLKRNSISHSHLDPSLQRPKDPALRLSEVSFSEVSKRRQSLDPSLYRQPIIPKPEELSTDNWLHYQSLPNIQEEEQQSQTSPTDTAAPETYTVNLHGHNSYPIFSIQPPSSPTNGRKLPSPPPTTTTTPTTITTIAFTFSTITTAYAISQDISDEDCHSENVKDDKTPPKQPPPPRPPTPPPRIATLPKQSSSDSHKSNNSNSSGNQLKGTNMPPGILRRRKDDLKPRQTSTDSDTTSYHTVNSYMQIEKSNSSSIDSFTSAISESFAASNNNGNGNSTNNTNTNNSNNNTNVNNNSSTCDTTNEPTVSINGSTGYLPSFPIESTLVPTITFSQSTPSVTSQSSDDQNSPKWDTKYSTAIVIDSDTSRSIRSPPPLSPNLASTTIIGGGNGGQIGTGSNNGDGRVTIRTNSNSSSNTN
ncbi:chloride channel forming protein [Blomia tropicalis]|nr:chloride channel forming protein [Blomia tropicalis]